MNGFKLRGELALGSRGVLHPVQSSLSVSVLERYFYDMDASNIVIRKGVFAQKEITLPFSRITDVYVDQDVLDAVFGLYDVHISTPTQQSGAFAHIDGVDKAGSQLLRTMILDGMNEGTGQSPVAR
jgi:membrane protein YdbS with pleckstrin-like domain